MLLLIAAFSAGCSKQPQVALGGHGYGQASRPLPIGPAATQPTGALSGPASTGARPDINGNHVMQYVKEVVAFGSRPPGSPEHAKLEQYILSKLKGVDVEQDKFTAQTPAGKFPINNIIAKFPGTKDGIIVVAGHYDTNYPLPKTLRGRKRRRLLNRSAARFG